MTEATLLLACYISFAILFPASIIMLLIVWFKDVLPEIKAEKLEKEKQKQTALFILELERKKQLEKKNRYY